MTIDYEVTVPNFWDTEQIERHRNESSWCASHAIDELQEIIDRDGCLCRLADFQWIEDVEGPFLNEQEDLVMPHHLPDDMNAAVHTQAIRDLRQHAESMSDGDREFVLDLYDMTRRHNGSATLTADEHRCLVRLVRDYLGTEREAEVLGQLRIPFDGA